ncbi:MAG TPA: helix-turn-helix transcriptional regulator [Polyangia bacterium]
MKIESALTDEAVLGELGARIARLRLERNLTQAALAEQAGISKRTLERLESGEVATQLSPFVRVCRALALLDRLDSFIPEPLPSPVAQLKLQGRTRRRASGSKLTPRKPRKWTWDEP